MICGATGAIAVVLPPVIIMHGIGGIFYTVIIAGAIQLFLGCIGAGSLISLVAFPVMVGFCNGLGIIIGLAQFNSFHRLNQPSSNSSSGGGGHLLAASGDSAQLLSGAFGAFSNPQTVWVDGPELGWMILEIVIAMLTVWGFPKINKNLPASLVAIVLCIMIEWLALGLGGAEGGNYQHADASWSHPTMTVGDVSSFSGSFPIPIWADAQYTPILPALTGSFITSILPYSLVVAMVGLLESLLTGM